MKHFKLSVVTTAAAILFGSMPAAIGSSAQRVGQYDFTYFTSGEMRATPVQVFDDGKSTYFQFRAGEAIPAIFQMKDGKTDLLVPTFEGPYVRVPEVAGRFTLQIGRSQAQVVYGGQGREGSPNITAVNANGMKTPYNGNGYPASPNVKLVASLSSGIEVIKNDALESNSYATPVKGDRVTWKDAETKTANYQIWFNKGSYALTKYGQDQLAANKAIYKAATKITVIGRDDDSYKEGIEVERAKVIKAALLKLGVDEARVAVKTGVHIEPLSGRWASDIRVETVSPTQISRPDAQSLQSDKNAYVRANLDALVKAGAITQEQAAALIRKPLDQRTVATVPDTEVSKNTEVPPSGFDFKSSDKSISQTMRRWAAATNYQVVWEAPPSADASITADAVIASASMKEALEKVVTGLQRKGYDIQATIYTNRVIRFTGSSK